MMEEENYPIFDEEECTDIVCEPVAEIQYARTADGFSVVHDRTDDLNWNQQPIQGPFSEEEAIAGIEEAEKELSNPNKWINRSGKDFIAGSHG